MAMVKKNLVQLARTALVLIPLVFIPITGAGSPSLQRLYVVNEFSDTVSVVDPMDLTIVATVPTGVRPHNVNVDPKGRYFYVTVRFTKESDDLVEVFDVRTNGLVASVKTGHQPTAIVPDFTGTHLYVSNKAANTLSIIAVPELKVIETLKLKGRGPQGLVMAPDGRTLLIPNGYTGDVSVVDLVHRKIDRITLPPGAKPVAMGITRDGRFAFVTDEGLNQVHKIDVANRTVVASLAVGRRPGQVPLHPTHPVLYIPCMGSASVYKVDVDGWKVDKVIPVGKGAHGIAYTADGRYAYVTLTGEKPRGRVAVIDTETDTVQTTFLVDKAPTGIALLFGRNQGW
jgi:YVTN family beta-propeller protein